MDLKRLNEVNDVEVISVFDYERFKTYGRIITGFQLNDFISYMEDHTDIPENGNIYVPSVKEMEKLLQAEFIKNSVYGGMEIEIGYCNGKNSTFNGFEYHKGSEINIAVTDLMLFLGHVWDIKDNYYHVDTAEVFFLPKGCAVEMYATTLHLSPCKTQDEGFKAIVILPKGTNADLKKISPMDDEGRLLLKKNKWVIAHPDRELLIKQGAFVGAKGINRELKY